MELPAKENIRYDHSAKLAHRPMASAVVKALGSSPFQWIGGKLFEHYVPVFMMHRFSVPEDGIEGHDAELVRWSLEYLRKHKFNFVSIEEIVTAISNGERLPPRSIAFSLDDGFWDQLEIGKELFAAFDCPATYFITTGFVDGDNWPWWSQVEHIVESASEDQLKRFQKAVGLNVSDQIRRKGLASMLTAELKSLSIDQMHARIAEWAITMEVDLPSDAPRKYAPTTWDDIRAVQAAGQQIGPHTYSHPILANEEGQKSYDEIKRSKIDMDRELGSYASVFCYPVGRRQDFGNREEEAARELGFSGGVGAIPGTIDMRDQSRIFSLPRYGFPDSKMDVIQYSTWIEVLKSKIR